MSEGETPHFDEILGNFGDALLALVNREVGPVNELLVNLPDKTSAYWEKLRKDRHTCSRAFV